MRISDWSSDVCSSDLALLHEGAAAFLVVLAAEAGVDQGLAAGEVPILRIPDVFGDASLRGGDRQGCITGNGRGEVGDAGFKFRRRKDAIDEPHEQRLRRAERSEEHTSELKSLMRTSSA